MMCFIERKEKGVKWREFLVSWTSPWNIVGAQTPCSPFLPPICLHLLKQCTRLERLQVALIKSSEWPGQEAEPSLPQSRNTCFETTFVLALLLKKSRTISVLWQRFYKAHNPKDIVYIFSFRFFSTLYKNTNVKTIYLLGASVS